ncbi:hypothetical protein [Streptomyces sp. NPDC002265]|uniref:2-oxoglutarate dehydrogenase E1 subunit family protein n=1 Tax=Streptomyces sp. NPDC002265 TaxID=3154415 RepID=UPI00332148C8
MAEVKRRPAVAPASGIGLRQGKTAIHTVASRSRTGQPVTNDFDFGPSRWFVDEQHERYLQDPDSVAPAWHHLCSAAPGADEATRGEADTAGDDATQAALKTVRVAALIHAYRVRGHLMADTDPGQRRPPPHAPERMPSRGFPPVVSEVHRGADDTRHDRVAADAAGRALFEIDGSGAGRLRQPTTPVLSPGPTRCGAGREPTGTAVPE